MRYTEDIARKKAISVTINENAVKEAREMGINISATMDAAL
ncbi:MAG: type II toxin-antitoxin system CcdA family antitoxin, partial [Bdellovibrionales bacterium]